VDGTARAELWLALLQAYAQLAETQAKTTRRFPLFLLAREEERENSHDG
jgi:hypothetical protein